MEVYTMAVLKIHGTNPIDPVLRMENADSFVFESRHIPPDNDYVWEVTTDAYDIADVIGVDLDTLFEQESISLTEAEAAIFRIWVGDDKRMYEEG